MIISLIFSILVLNFKPALMEKRDQSLYQVWLSGDTSQWYAFSQSKIPCPQGILHCLFYCD